MRTIDPFSRTGHITDLGLELYHHRALSPSMTRKVEAHLASCPVCRDRVEALGPAPLPAPANRSASWAFPLVGGLGTVAAVLALAISVGNPPSGSPFRAKGGPVLEVWSHNGLEAHRLEADDVVSPDERLGFRVPVQQDGFVAIYSVDELGQRSVVFPSEGSTAAFVEAAPDPPLLPVAVRLDDSPGAEVFHAVICERAVRVEEVWRDEGAAEGCTHTDLRVLRAGE